MASCSDVFLHNTDDSLKGDGVSSENPLIKLKEIIKIFNGVTGGESFG